jgi:hypothetical protein
MFMKDLIRTLLLFLLALPAFAQTSEDILLRRLGPVLDGHAATAVVYRSYASGRPQLVVVAARREEDAYGERTEEGDVLLVRFPDAAQGRLRVLHHTRIDWLPITIEVVHVIDPDDILVTCMARHSPPAFLYRVEGQRLVEIADFSVYWGLLTADLDHDSVPELISTGCCDPTQCGMGIPIRVQTYDGKRYRADKRTYIDFLSAEAGAAFEKPLPLPRGDPGSTTKRCRFHIINDGASSARVQFDGVDLVPPSKLRNFQRVARTLAVKIPQTPRDCHTVRVSATGPPGSQVHVLVEELP